RAARVGTAVPGPEILRVEGLSGPPTVKDVSFTLRKGEILGFAGLIGAGRTEMARILFGAAKKTGGRVLLEGKDVRIGSPRDAAADTDPGRADPRDRRGGEGGGAPDRLGPRGGRRLHHPHLLRAARDPGPLRSGPGDARGAGEDGAGERSGDPTDDHERRPG